MVSMIIFCFENACIKFPVPAIQWALEREREWHIVKDEILSQWNYIVKCN